MSASLFSRVACDICGPLEPPQVHSLCHEQGRPPFIRPGCGHALDDHSPSLKCRVCGRECGLYCRPEAA